MTKPLIPAALAAALLFPAGVALACDDHHGTCEIEDWKATYMTGMQAIRIDGVATCDTGRITLRLYDGEGNDRKFIAVETTYIEGHAFKEFARPFPKPAALSIRYSIEQR